MVTILVIEEIVNKGGLYQEILDQKRKRKTSFISDDALTK